MSGCLRKESIKIENGFLNQRATYPHSENPIFFSTMIRMGIQKVFVIESDNANDADPFVMVLNL